MGYSALYLNPSRNIRSKMSHSLYQLLRSRNKRDSGKSKSILVIDDDLAIRVILHNILHKDFISTTLSNGLEAIAWLANNERPDLIISDINMPMIDGITFVKMMSQSGLYRDIPIIILSGHQEEQVKNNVSLYMNVVAWIDKPFDPLHIRGKIGSLLRCETTETA